MGERRGHTPTQMRRYRYLFEQMVRRELRRKYKGSALGILWYVVNPLVLAGAYTLMFSTVLRYDAIEDYPLFLVLGIVVWVFFSQSLLAAAGSLIEQSALVRKVRFPRETIPASVVATQLVIFAVLFCMLVPVALAVRGSLSPALLLLPPIVLALGVFVLGLALAVAVLHASATSRRSSPPCCSRGSSSRRSSFARTTSPG